MTAPWDDVRAARVLDRAAEARRPRNTESRPLGWMVALAVASLATVFFAGRPLPPRGDPPAQGVVRETRPTVVSSPSDTLDGGKQTG
jgi:hypothetical protein